MKLWIRMSDGKFIGYQSDFPAGIAGCTLEDRDFVPTRAPITIESSATVVTAVEVVSDERLVLEDAYAEKHGKRPHPAMKLEKLKDAVK